MNNTIKHLKNGDFEVIKTVVRLTKGEYKKITPHNDTFYLIMKGEYIKKEYLYKRFINWIKQPTLKETKW